MKKCTRFHFEDLEWNDRITCSLPVEAALCDDNGPSTFTGFYRRQSLTQNFGRVLDVVDEATNEERQIYLEDDWIITYTPIKGSENDRSKYEYRRHQAG